LKKKKVTINDIARISGYSKTAVSFAFNNPSKISKEAVKAILSTAEKLGYFPDPLARRFSLQRHESIGFLLPQTYHYSFKNPYIMSIIEGVGTFSHNHFYNLTLIAPINESITTALQRAAIDALIVQGLNFDTEIAALIKSRKLPTVAIDGIPSLDIGSVNIDDKKAANELMEEVLQCGHRNLAIVELPDLSYTKEKSRGVLDLRSEGYQEAFDRYNVDKESISYYKTECSFTGGIEVAYKILKMPKLPTCIITMSDIVAIGIMTVLIKNGIDIPNQISVVGFDNIAESVYVSPRLTTVSQPSYEKGFEAAQIIFEILDGQTARQVKLPHSLVKRESLKKID
jgi:DNA-binding LacI/PurR family transcriptional regulator